MYCIYCQHTQTKITNTRTIESSGVIKRRRQCLKCGKRFTTYEQAKTNV